MAGIVCELLATEMLTGVGASLSTPGMNTIDIKGIGYATWMVIGVGTNTSDEALRHGTWSTRRSLKRLRDLPTVSPGGSHRMTQSDLYKFLSRSKLGARATIAAYEHAF
jgi:hypothetical protein